MIKSALVSVFNKEHLSPIIKALKDLNIQIYATGGTKDFILKEGAPVIPVEELTQYPSILGGRVKTLHPKIFGGILGRRESKNDLLQLEEYQIPQIDIVIVDLYPFAEALQNNAGHDDIIEKIDIGGVSLVRAAAKNYKDVLIIPSKNEYEFLLKLLKERKGISTLEERKYMAAKAFALTSNYDLMIGKYLQNGSAGDANDIPLRYGENPHQKGFYEGDLSACFNQLNGKELSYNNILDINSALLLIEEFDEPTVAILKHNNACGAATSDRSLLDAWNRALSGDPVSAFGGIVVSNRPIDEETAVSMNEIFLEVVMAPSYEGRALQILQEKKNRIILELKEFNFNGWLEQSVLNGKLKQERDQVNTKDLEYVSEIKPTSQEKADLLFANKIVKHSKSNAIVLVKNQQLLASGVGQTSRVDALNQAIEKAHKFDFSLKGAVMASDAFFPFPDCVEIAHKAGIHAVIQPGGSINDKKSIEYCNKNGLSMVLTGIRHFKH